MIQIPPPRVQRLESLLCRLLQILQIPPRVHNRPFRSRRLHENFVPRHGLSLLLLCATAFEHKPIKSVHIIIIQCFWCIKPPLLHSLLHSFRRGPAREVYLVSPQVHQRIPKQRSLVVRPTGKLRKQTLHCPHCVLVCDIEGVLPFAPVRGEQLRVGLGPCCNMPRRVQLDHHPDAPRLCLFDNFLHVLEGVSLHVGIRPLPQFGEFPCLQRERLCVDDVPVEDVEFGDKHPVEEAVDYGKGQEVSRGIDQNSSVGETGGIPNRNLRGDFEEAPASRLCGEGFFFLSGCALNRHFDQLKHSREASAHCSPRGGGHKHLSAVFFECEAVGFIEIFSVEITECVTFLFPSSVASNDKTLDAGRRFHVLPHRCVPAEGETLEVLSAL
mmetsp:Transcript_47548/g.93817  ORF Transcript_47548/g.93817 Transcript_47548/m.93817 type:complete len:384 (+) Transcript_47548:986-2137(+)